MNNQYMMKQNPDFMQFVCNQEDAEQEERLATMTHNGKTEEDWDRYEAYYPKGTKR